MRPFVISPLSVQNLLGVIAALGQSVNGSKAQKDCSAFPDLRKKMIKKWTWILFLFLELRLSLLNSLLEILFKM